MSSVMDCVHTSFIFGGHHSPICASLIEEISRKSTNSYNDSASTVSASDTLGKSKKVISPIDETFKNLNISPEGMFGFVLNNDIYFLPLCLMHHESGIYSCTSKSIFAISIGWRDWRFLLILEILKWIFLKCYWTPGIDISLSVGYGWWGRWSGFSSESFALSSNIVMLENNTSRFSRMGLFFCSICHLLANSGIMLLFFPHQTDRNSWVKSSFGCRLRCHPLL